MDEALDKETYEVLWKYVKRPEEEESEFEFEKFYLGWHMFVDYRTMTMHKILLEPLFL